ncbi:hypothetical protein, partial [Cellulomonas algicola]|uniref:hypothetical protein n=1 Tax=Cellulomonas algicola TaxID=2071633 RepID=UPI0013594B98
PDLPLVARSTAAPDATASAGPGATTGAGPAQALSVGPLLAGRPAPVQLADRPPTLLAGQVATRRAVPVQRAVPGAPAPASPRTGGATLTTPVLDPTRGGAASAVGAVASRRADGSTDPVPSHGADLAVALTGTSPARSTTHPDAADDSRPTDAPAVLPVPSATASPVDGALVTLQRTSAPGTSATTDRPLTPLSPGGAGAPVGPTVSRPTTPVRADASSADTTATGTTEVPGPLPLVQRRVEPTSTPPTLPPEPPAATPTVQRSDDAAPPPPVATPVAAADAAGAAPEGSGASPFATATPADLDELARRLMTPLMRRVRGQLLVDRERRGTRIDR